MILSTYFIYNKSRTYYVYEIEECHKFSLYVIRILSWITSVIIVQLNLEKRRYFFKNMSESCLFKLIIKINLWGYEIACSGAVIFRIWNKLFAQWDSYKQRPKITVMGYRKYPYEVIKDTKNCITVSIIW